MCGSASRTVRFGDRTVGDNKCYGSDNEMNKDTWGQIRDDLIHSVGKNNFVNWIEPLEFSRLENGVATFHVPTNFMGDWVQRNFGEKILQLLGSAESTISRVQFSVPAMAGASAPMPTRPKPVTAQTSISDDIDLPGAPLDPKFSFDRFVDGKPNELAHAAARRVCPLAGRSSR